MNVKWSKVVSLHLLGSTEFSHGKTVRMASVPTEIRTEYLANTYMSFVLSRLLYSVIRTTNSKLRAAEPTELLGCVPVSCTVPQDGVTKQRQV
jgi:hypothetical protein